MVKCIAELSLISRIVQASDIRVMGCKLQCWNCLTYGCIVSSSIYIHMPVTFRFKAYPHGTHYYHSHVGLQRGDGVAGALVVNAVNDPNKNLYDYDLPEHTVILQDWYEVGVLLPDRYGVGVLHTDWYGVYVLLMDWYEVGVLLTDWYEVGMLLIDWYGVGVLLTDWYGVYVLLMD